MAWGSNREITEHKDECAERYKAIATALERLGDKADLATAAAISAARDAQAAAVEAAEKAKSAVSDLERRQQRWLIALLLAVLGTALTSLIHIPQIHFGS